MDWLQKIRRKEDRGEDIPARVFTERELLEQADIYISLDGQYNERRKHFVHLEGKLGKLIRQKEVTRIIRGSSIIQSGISWYGKPYVSVNKANRLGQPSVDTRYSNLIPLADAFLQAEAKWKRIKAEREGSKTQLAEIMKSIGRTSFVYDGYIFELLGEYCPFLYVERGVDLGENARNKAE